MLPLSSGPERSFSKRDYLAVPAEPQHSTNWDS